LTGNHELPQINTGKTTPEEIVKAMGKAYFGSAKPLSIATADLKTRLIDMKDTTTYLIIDVRSPEIYAKGHIPTAVNIPFADTMKLENLKRFLPIKPSLLSAKMDKAQTKSQRSITSLGIMPRYSCMG
jgi:3-mercaptopyruvate sulfurtransferase SseA